MNKQEAIKELRRQSTQVYDQRAVELEQAISIVNKIDTPEKPIIPQFVADWLELCKEHLAIGLFSAMSPSFMRENDQQIDLIFWIKRTKNQKTFARAWLDGYEVEQEQLYTVEIPNPNNDSKNVLVLRDVFGDVEICKVNVGTYKQSQYCQLTEKEIKEDFEWAWKFAEPVEVE